MMLGLVVDPHMICDISRREQFAANMARNFVLVSDHMSTQPVLCGKRRLACLQKGTKRVFTLANLSQVASYFPGFFLMLKYFICIQLHYMFRQIQLQKMNTEMEPG